MSTDGRAHRRAPIVHDIGSITGVLARAKTRQRRCGNAPAACRYPRVGALCVRSRLPRGVLAVWGCARARPGRGRHDRYPGCVGPTRQSARRGAGVTGCTRRRTDLARVRRPASGGPGPCAERAGVGMPRRVAARSAQDRALPHRPARSPARQAASDGDSSLASRCEASARVVTRAYQRCLSPVPSATTRGFRATRSLIGLSIVGSSMRK